HRPWMVLKIPNLPRDNQPAEWSCCRRRIDLTQIIQLAYRETSPALFQAACHPVRYEYHQPQVVQSDQYHRSRKTWRYDDRQYPAVCVLLLMFFHRVMLLYLFPETEKR